MAAKEDDYCTLRTLQILVTRETDPWGLFHGLQVFVFTISCNSPPLSPFEEESYCTLLIPVITDVRETDPMGLFHGVRRFTFTNTVDYGYNDHGYNDQMDSMINLAGTKSNGPFIKCISDGYNDHVLRIITII